MDGQLLQIHPQHSETRYGNVDSTELIVALALFTRAHWEVSTSLTFFNPYSTFEHFKAEKPS